MAGSGCVEEGWDPFYFEEYCWHCCTEFRFNSNECPCCNCDEILDAMVEGDPEDLVEECIDELDCPLEDWDDP